VGPGEWKAPSKKCDISLFIKPSACAALSRVGAWRDAPGAGLPHRRRDGGLPALQGLVVGTIPPRPIGAEGVPAVQGRFVVARAPRRTRASHGGAGKGEQPGCQEDGRGESAVSVKAVIRTSAPMAPYHLGFKVFANSITCSTGVAGGLPKSKVGVNAITSLSNSSTVTGPSLSRTASARAS
jgi:hypothetical protein